MLTNTGKNQWGPKNTCPKFLNLLKRHPGLNSEKSLWFRTRYESMQTKKMEKKPQPYLFEPEYICEKMHAGRTSDSLDPPVSLNMTRTW